MVGINIQAPFADQLLDGDKCVETRTYSIPEKYIGEELAVIETPGKHGKFKARIIGTITFSHSFEYLSETDWKWDYNRHLVEQENILYGWNDDKNKHGWVVSDFQKFEEPLPAPKRKGIVFTNNCDIEIKASGIGIY
jgi:hypothetical protein